MANEEGGWFRAAATRLLSGSTGFDAGDKLLDRHLECCIRLRTLHSDASKLNIWPYTLTYRECWKIAGIDAARATFRRTVVGQLVRK